MWLGQKVDHERVNSWWAGNLSDAFTSRPTSMRRDPRIGIQLAFRLKLRSMPMTWVNRRELVIASALGTLLGPHSGLHTPPAGGRQGGTRHLSLSHRHV